MRGFEPSVEQVIQQIRHNLTDRYRSAAAVLREIVQNADDAGAREIEIGWSPPLPVVSHPLLGTCPGFWALNNAPLKAPDARALHQLGLSNKPDDPGSIGRFGLGLKSVFRMCEAFFYVSSGHTSFDRQPEEDRYSPDGFLNPWSRDGRDRYHPAWEGEVDLEILKRHLAPHLRFPEWFCLWIPLRTRDSHGTATPIHEWYVADPLRPAGEVFERDVEIELGRLLPMLQNVSVIRGQGWNSDGDRRQVFEEVFEVRLVEGHSRRTYPNIETGQRRNLHGTVACKSSGDERPRVIRFGGVEELIEDHMFEELRQSPEWPQAGVVVPAGVEQRPEGADPHCAVSVADVPRSTRGPSDGGRLWIWPTVFLPLGEPAEQVPCGGESDFVLTLHGHLFVDAGRRRIDLPEGGTARLSGDHLSVRQQWNRRLLDKGTYRLVLPALERFAATESAEAIERLTSALQRSALFKENSQPICQEEQWIYRIDAQASAWQRIAADATFYEIPDPPRESPALHFEVFPALQEICDELPLTYADTPRLSRAAAGTWPEHLLLRLLSSTRPRNWHIERHFNYLVGMLRGAASASIGRAVAQRLVAIAQAVFAESGLDAVRKGRPHLYALAALLPGEALASLDLERVNEQVADLIMCRLWSLRLEILLLPSDTLRRADTEHRRIGHQDAAEILEALATLDSANQPAGRFSDGRASIAAQVISMVAEAERGPFWERCGHLRVFPARDYSRPRQERTTLLSFAELEVLRSRRTLFQMPAHLAEVLQRAIASERVILLESDVAKRLFGDVGVPSCQERGCIDALAERPRLTTSQRRADLLRAVVAPVLRGEPTVVERQAIRYLLHGDVEQFTSEAALYVGRGDVWDTLAHLALGADGGLWRLVSGDLARILSEEDSRKLGVCRIDRGLAVALVRGAAAARVDCGALTEEERTKIVRDWPDAELDALRSLPIHETTSGRLVAINARSYWQGDQSLEGAFEDRITLLRLAGDPMTAARQRRLADVLTPESALDLILGDAHPEQRAPFILDLVQRIGHIPQPVRERLRTACWLITEQGDPVAPCMVIRVEGADREIRRALQESSGAHTQRGVPWLAVAEQLRTHAAMELIRELFPAQPDALAVLASSLAGDERFRTGLLDAGALDIATWAEAFRGAPGDLMPVWPLIDRLVVLIGCPAVRDGLLIRLVGAFEWSRVTAVLAHLSACHERALAEDRARLLALHDQYLKAALEQGATRSRELMRQFRWLSAAGRWKTAGELVLPSDTLDPDWVLTESQARILAPVIPRGPGQRPGGVTWPSGHLPVTPDALDRALGEDVTRLQELCTEWEESCADRASIGAVLALLGGHPEIEQLANRYAHPQTVEGLRERLPWTALPAPLGGAGETAAERMARQRFKIAVSMGETVRTTNLLGEGVEVPLRQDFTHLGVRSLTYWNVGSHYVSEIWFRPLPAGGVQSVRPLDELLRETARWLLVHVYDQPDGSAVDQWWPTAGSEQLAIEVAQTLILNSMVFYLRQLGLRAEADLHGLIQDWDHAQRNRAQAQYAAVQGTPLPGALEDAERREYRVREGLRQLLEGGGHAATEVLAAVRQKVRQYEYKLESVAFELFQNADDAYVELAQMQASGGTAPPCRFVVRMDAEALRFAHWGRAVNQYRVRGYEEWTARGFDRDLEKMLVLQMSDKGVWEQHSGTTGKFGLGFKSTLLVSDSPRVVSGRIGFEVVGGVFPRRLPEEDDRRLRRALRTLGGEVPGGTLIELPLEREEEIGPVRDAVDRFVWLAPFLVVFARAIRACRIELPGGAVALSEWTERPLEGLRQTAVGQLSPLAGPSAAPATVAVFRTQTGALLLKIGDRGFEKLPAEIPTVWVTAPTSEGLGFGFAVNGSFDVDVGRAQLARASSRNDELADGMGTEIGRALCEMFDRACADWEALRNALGLSIDATPLSLWSSVWSLLGPPVAAGSGPAADLLRRLLWGADDHGMAQLVITRPALPTGLGVGGYGALTRLDHVRWVAVGALEDDRVFSAVAGWLGFRGQWQPGSIVSAEQRNGLRLLLVRCPAFQELRMVDVLAGEVSDGRATPAVADRLGEVVTPDFLERLGTEAEVGHRESQEIRDWLAGLFFQALDSSWQPAVRLLIGHDERPDSKDEILRTGFAPADRVLAPDYGRRAVEFVRAARRMRAGAEELATWALRADGDETRQAVLEYLLRGELSRALGERLRPAVGGTWLEELTDDSPLLGHFTPSDRAVIRGQLGLFVVPPPPPPAPPPVSAAQVLARLYDWWSANSVNLISEYEREVYPDGRVPNWTNDNLRTDVSARRDWLILFMLGMTHTMGRSTAAQHREFVRLCDRRRWLNDFAQPVERNPERWIRVLEEYLTDRVQDVEYFAWMRLFVSIFQCARWLDHYAQAFWDARRARAAFRLADVTEPRASALRQGTEIDAPPVSRTLGMGACFVMRELSRSGRIYNEHVSRHCYTPLARVRRLLQEIGWDGPTDEEQSGRDRVTLSGSIYDFLVEHLGRDRAHFDHAFDIPLLAITQARHHAELLTVLGRDVALDESAPEGEEEQGVW